VGRVCLPAEVSVAKAGQFRHPPNQFLKENRLATISQLPKIDSGCGVCPIADVAGSKPVQDRHLPMK